MPRRAPRSGAGRPCQAILFHLAVNSGSLPS